MTRSRTTRFVAVPLLWAAVLGAVGSVAGFIGPGILNPGSNLGPLLGIFLTGPLGFAAGLVLGFIAAALNLTARAQAYCLALAALLWAAGVLFKSLPEARSLGTVFEAGLSDD